MRARARMRPRALPTVSVVIPVKDDRDELERCLRALAAQTVLPDEIVVVDNGSSDGSAEVALSFGVRVLAEPRPGIPAAASTGYDAARADVIGRLDADSVPDVRWVETIVTTFAAHPELDALTGPARFSDGPRAGRTALAALYLGAYRLALAPALGHVPLFGSNLALRRDAWRDVRRRIHLDPELHDDLDLSFHLGVRHRIRHEPRLRVSISQRPLWSLSALRVRFRRGFATVFAHWPADLPWRRWRRIVLARRAAARSERGAGRQAAASDQRSAG
ncbi:glycosyltransferase family 2 protein [Cnuibacter physcomitrellae]|nr:glycosyltransferase family 2 protein [Cnuibacter physcomitrellae]